MNRNVPVSPESVDRQESPVSKRPLQSLEIAMILADAVTVRRITVCHDGNITMFMMPYAAAFVAASLEYFRACGMAKGSLGEHEQRVWRARQSVKLLDERGVLPRARLDRLGGIVAAHRREFVDRHQGLLRPVQRFLQPDLGLYFQGEDLVATTHHLTNHFGFDDARIDAMGTIALGDDNATQQEFARVMGEYIANVLEKFGQELKPPSRATPTIQSRDVKSRHLYGRLVLDATGDGAAMALASALATANLARVTLPKILSSTDDIEEAFLAKWTIVSLFHAKSAIEIVLSQHHRREVLRPNIVTSLVALQRRLRSLGEQRPLRNVLMHYAIDDVDLSGDNTLARLIAVMSRRPYRDFRRGVSDALLDLATTLQVCIFGDGPTVAA